MARTKDFTRYTVTVRDTVTLKVSTKIQVRTLEIARDRCRGVVECGFANTECVITRTDGTPYREVYATIADFE